MHRLNRIAVSGIGAALAVTMLAVVTAAPADAQHAGPQLTRSMDYLRKRTSLEGEAVVSIIRDGKSTQKSSFFRLLKPNLGQLRLTDEKGQIDALWISDGKTLTVVREGVKEFSRLKPGDFGQILVQPVGTASPLQFFLDPDRLTTQSRGAPQLEGSVQRDGETLDLIRLRAGLWVFINKDGLVRGTRVSSGPKVTFETFLRSVRIDPALDPKQFAYDVPPGFKDITPGPAPRVVLETGIAAPDFELPDLTGAASRFSRITGKKATILHFWFAGGPTAYSDELPHLKALKAALGSDGLAVVGVNGGEPLARFADKTRKMELGFPVLSATGPGAAEMQKQYDVRVYPTTYLLDADGKVAWSGPGWNPRALNAALTKMGLKPPAIK